MIPAGPQLRRPTPSWPVAATGRAVLVRLKNGRKPPVLAPLPGRLLPLDARPAAGPRHRLRDHHHHHRRDTHQPLPAGHHPARPPPLPGIRTGHAVSPALGDRIRLPGTEVDHPRRPGPARPHPRRHRPGDLRPAGRLPAAHGPPWPTPPAPAPAPIPTGPASASPGRPPATRSSRPRASSPTPSSTSSAPSADTSWPAAARTATTRQPPHRQTRHLQIRYKARASTDQLQSHHRHRHPVDRPDQPITSWPWPLGRGESKLPRSRA